MTNESLVEDYGYPYNLQLALDLLPEHVEFEPRLIDTLVQILDAVAELNKELPYHNQEHAVHVMRRSFVVYRSLHESLPEEFDDRSYELLAIAAASHDIFQHFTNPGENERLSAQAAVSFMFDYTSEECTRVYEAIVATSVSRSEEGTIQQCFLQEGSRDPLKFVLATADINGIALEGVPRMLEDAVHLYLEFNKIPTDASFIAHSKEIGAFLTSQAAFLKDRLNAVTNDIEYYWPMSVDPQQNEVVNKVMAELFKPSTAALSLAHILELPGIFESITHVISQNARTVRELPELLKAHLKPAH